MTQARDTAKYRNVLLDFVAPTSPASPARGILATEKEIETRALVFDQLHATYQIHAESAEEPQKLPCREIVKFPTVRDKKDNIFAASDKYLSYLYQLLVLVVSKESPGKRAKLRGHSSTIRDIKFSNSTTLATCGDEGEIFIWDLSEEISESAIVKPLLKIFFAQSSDESFLRIEWHPSENTLAVISSFNEIYIWNIPQLLDQYGRGAFVEIETTQAYRIPVGSPIADVAFQHVPGPEGSQLSLLVADANGSVRVWSFAHNQFTLSFTPHPGKALGTLLALPSNFLLTSTANHSELKVWNLAQLHAPEPLAPTQTLLFANGDFKLLSEVSASHLADQDNLLSLEPSNALLLLASTQHSKVSMFQFSPDFQGFHYLTFYDTVNANYSIVASLSRSSDIEIQAIQRTHIYSYSAPLSGCLRPAKLSSKATIVTPLLLDAPVFIPQSTPVQSDLSQEPPEEPDETSSNTSDHEPSDVSPHPVTADPISTHLNLPAPTSLPVPVPVQVDPAPEDNSSEIAEENPREVSVHHSGNAQLLSPASMQTENHLQDQSFEPETTAQRLKLNLDSADLDLAAGLDSESNLKSPTDNKSPNSLQTASEPSVKKDKKRQRRKRNKDDAKDSPKDSPRESEPVKILTRPKDSNSSSNVSLVPVPEPVAIQDSPQDPVKRKRASTGKSTPQLVEASTSVSSSQLKDLEASLSAKMEKLINAHMERIHTKLAERERKEKELAVQLVSTITERMDRAIHTEVQNLIPAISLKVTQQLSNDKFHARLTENVKKSVKSGLNENLSGAIRSPVQAEFRSHFETILVPAFEQACQKMFLQMNTAFQQGIQYHFQQLTAKETAATAGHLTDVVNTLSQVCDSMVNSMAHNKQPTPGSAIRELSTPVDKMQQMFSQPVMSGPTPYGMPGGNPMPSGLPQGFTPGLAYPGAPIPFPGAGNPISNLNASGAAIPVGAIPLNTPPSMGLRGIFPPPSQEVTPTSENTPPAAGGNVPKSPTIAPATAEESSSQFVINRLLTNRDYDRAFNQALTAQDLDLVLNTCAKVQPNDVFMPVSKLSQPVIVALIQQLSFDLTQALPVKLNWLYFAAEKLQVNDPAIAPHVRSVVTQVVNNLNQATRTSPPDNFLHQVLRVYVNLLNSCH